MVLSASLFNGTSNPFVVIARFVESGEIKVHLDMILMLMSEYLVLCFRLLSVL